MIHDDDICRHIARAYVDLLALVRSYCDYVFRQMRDISALLAVLPDARNTIIEHMSHCDGVFWYVPFALPNL